MHDIIGNAGMLRGWVAIWSMQAMWLLATMTLAIGAMVVAELRSTRRARRTRGKELS